MTKTPIEELTDIHRFWLERKESIQQYNRLVSGIFRAFFGGDLLVKP